MQQKKRTHIFLTLFYCVFFCLLLSSFPFFNFSCCIFVYIGLHITPLLLAYIFFCCRFASNCLPHKKIFEGQKNLISIFKSLRKYHYSTTFITIIIIFFLATVFFHLHSLRPRFRINIISIHPIHHHRQLRTLRIHTKRCVDNSNSIQSTTTPTSLVCVCTSYLMLMEELCTNVECTLVFFSCCS